MAMTTGQSDSFSDDALPPPRRLLLRALFYFLTPLLLDLPRVLTLRYDAGQRRVGNEMLMTQIKQLDMRIFAVKDLNTIHDRLMARKQIVDVLAVYETSTSDLWTLMGRLPQGVQLQSLRQDIPDIDLQLRCADPALEPAVVDLMTKNGYVKIRISERQIEADGKAERIRLLARGDSE